MSHFLSRGWVRSIALLSLLWLAGCAAPTVDQPGATQTPGTTATPAVSQPTATPESSGQPTATQEPVVSQPPTPTSEPAAAPTAASMPPVDEIADVAAAEALLEQQQAAWLDHNVLVGISRVEGDFAAGLSLPAGERPQYAFLRRESGVWNVIEATSMPSSARLEQLGIPLEVAEANDAYFLLDGMMSRMQGTNVSGIIRVEDIVGDYARVAFIPANPTMVEGSISFWKRAGDSWTWLTAGTAFMPEDLRALGVPDELWVNRPQR